MGSRKRKRKGKTKVKQKAKLTPQQRAEKKRLKRETMIVFMNGKQKRVPRPPKIDDMYIDEYLFANADPIFLIQNGMYEYLPACEDYLTQNAIADREVIDPEFVSDVPLECTDGWYDTDVINQSTQKLFKLARRAHLVNQMDLFDFPRHYEEEYTDPYDIDAASVSSERLFALARWATLPTREERDIPF